MTPEAAGPAFSRPGRDGSAAHRGAPRVIVWYKEALEQFRGVFGSLQATKLRLQRRLDRARGPRPRDRAQSALRPLLLDVARPARPSGGSAHAVPGGAATSLARPPVAPGPEVREYGGLAGGVAYDIAASGLQVLLWTRAWLPPNWRVCTFDPRLARAIGTAARRNSVAEEPLSRRSAPRSSGTTRCCAQLR